MLLEVENLKKYYPVKRGLLYKTVALIKAVDGVSFYLEKGKTLGLVGESGCGKTTLARLITKLIEPDSGKVNFLGQEISKLSPSKMRPLRKDLQIVFQDPFNSLDPRFTVARIIQEGVLALGILKTRRKIEELCSKMLDEVGLPQDSLGRYPHEFSGGQRQRISLARSLVLKPKLLILDEPVSSLDVTIQAQVINLLLKLQKKLGLAYLFIAHDLNLVQAISDEVCVMYLGKIMEKAKSKDLFSRPRHPYTEALLSATPQIKPQNKKKRIRLKGDLPSPMNPPSGCCFHTRCKYAQNRCQLEEPQLLEQDNRLFACHFPL
jgi:oligopeptide transport system ATP-binding protein